MLICASLLIAASVSIGVVANNEVEVNASSNVASNINQNQANKVTSTGFVNSLNANDIVVITGTVNYKVSLGIITDQGEEVSYTNTPENGRRFVVVKGTSTNSYAFEDINTGKYISWTSGTTLSESTTLNSASSWGVSFNEDSSAVVTNKNGFFNALCMDLDNGVFTTCGFFSYLFGNVSDVRFYKVGAMDNGQEAANRFALQFNSLLLGSASYCDPNGASSNLNGVQSAWSAMSTSYSKLSKATKDIIANAQPNPSGNQIEKMVAQYVFIYAKYHASLALTNFMNRSDIPSASLAKGSAPLIDDSSWASIVIISLIGLTSALGFIIHKRKQHNN